jgi:DNA-binding MarR family transcriptional regulator
MSTRESIPHSETLKVHDRCLCLHTQRAARALARRFDEAFRPLGITSGQFSLLIALNRPEPPRIGDVATVLAMDRTTLTASLKPLERRRLVSIRSDRDDKRVRRLGLTTAGQSLLARALPLWERTQAACEALLSDAGRARADLRALD